MATRGVARAAAQSYAGGLRWFLTGAVAGRGSGLVVGGRSRSPSGGAHRQGNTAAEFMQNRVGRFLISDHAKAPAPTRARRAHLKSPPPNSSGATSRQPMAKKGPSAWGHALRPRRCRVRPLPTDQRIIPKCCTRSKRKARRTCRARSQLEFGNRNVAIQRSENQPVCSHLNICQIDPQLELIHHPAEG